MSDYTLFVGVDISARSAHIHWDHPESQQQGNQQIQQNKTSYQQFAKALLKLEVNPQRTHLVMEATGNYWLALALFAYEQGFAVSVINPFQGKNFAKTLLRRAKTDPIDAQLLCEYGRIMQPHLWTPPPQIYYDLQQRLALRDDLVSTRTQFRNRIHAMKQHTHLQPQLLDILSQQIEHLNTHIAQLEREIQQLLNDNHQWRQAAQHLLTIPGIGSITAAWLLTSTHCFERCETGDQAAAYAGLVPHPQQSGQSNKKGKTGGGNKTLRSMLYLAAGAALQYNPPLKSFYQKLVKRGKIKQVARVAVARKLMIIAWACVIKQRDFDPDFANKSKFAA